MYFHVLRRPEVRLYAASLTLLLASGCGGPSNVGKVSGRVTLDGQPLSQARIEFTPNGSGAPSMGLTDENGAYELKYTRSVEGALLGAHTVRITTYVPANPESDPPVAGTSERLPTKCNANTQLTGMVESGANEIDFTLDSQGEILSPDQPVRVGLR